MISIKGERNNQKCKKKINTKSQKFNLKSIQSSYKNLSKKCENY